MSSMHFDYDYFNYKYINSEIIYIPKEIIHDIIYDDSTYPIPFTNKFYKIYQDITFKLVDYFQYNYPYLIIKIKLSDSIPEIIISNVNELNFKFIQSKSNEIINKYINNKFLLIN